MTDQVEIITAMEASRILKANGIHMSPDTLRLALKQKVFPWGWTIVDEKDGHIIQAGIIKSQMMKWIAEMKME